MCRTSATYLGITAAPVEGDRCVEISLASGRKLVQCTVATCRSETPDLKWFRWFIILGQRANLKRTSQLFNWRILGKFQYYLEKQVSQEQIPGELDDGLDYPIFRGRCNLSPALTAMFAEGGHISHCVGNRYSRFPRPPAKPGPPEATQRTGLWPSDDHCTQNHGREYWIARV